LAINAIPCALIVVAAVVAGSRPPSAASQFDRLAQHIEIADMMARIKTVRRRDRRFARRSIAMRLDDSTKGVIRLGEI